MHMNNGVISTGQGQGFRLDVGEAHAQFLGDRRKSDLPADAGPHFGSIGAVGHGLKKDFLQLEHGRTRLQGAVPREGTTGMGSFRRVGLRTV